MFAFLAYLFMVLLVVGSAVLGVQVLAEGKQNTPETKPIAAVNTATGAAAKHTAKSAKTTKSGRVSTSQKKSACKGCNRS